MSLKDENVGWFYIAVNNALGVGGVKSVGHLDGDVEQELEF